LGRRSKRYRAHVIGRFVQGGVDWFVLIGGRGVDLNSNLNTNQYKPIWHKDQCEGSVKGSVLRLFGEF